MEQNLRKRLWETAVYDTTTECRITPQRCKITTLVNMILKHIHRDRPEPTFPDLHTPRVKLWRWSLNQNFRAGSFFYSSQLRSLNPNTLILWEHVVDTWVLQFSSVSVNEVSLVLCRIRHDLLSGKTVKNIFLRTGIFYQFDRWSQCSWVTTLSLFF